VDVAVLAQKVAKEVGPGEEELTVRVGDVPGVDGDPVRLREVLANLVTNAMQHSPDGVPITIGVGREHREGGEWVVINITDEGPGIAPDPVPYLIERFRGTGDSSRMGLGPYLSHRLVEAHGGSQTVDTTVGQGTTFWVALPAGAK
jgi:two-component system, OmpR family, sensor kinase